MALRSLRAGSSVLRCLTNRSQIETQCARGFAESASEPKKILAVLYRAGEASKEPKMLGCVENELGLREFLESRGHTYVVTADKEGDGCEFDQHLVDADVIITTPFHPGYLTPERIEKAKKLKLALTAGIGSDHVNLHAAAKHGITVAEITGSNVVSVAEHVVMQILALVRNYMVGYTQVKEGQWDVAKIAMNAYDLEDKVVGTVGAGRIGRRVLQRLKGFDLAKMYYTDYKPLDKETEDEIGCEYVKDVGEMVSKCDVVTVNCPLHDGTQGMFNDELIGKMKKGSYLVNTARGAIMDRDAVVRALESGHLQGYAGDVWYPQPAPGDHPWRQMPRHAMTPHYSGTTLDAQARYAAGTRDILERFFEGRKLNPTDVILEGGKMAAQYDHSADEKERNMKFAAEWEQKKVQAGH